MIGDRSMSVLLAVPSESLRAQGERAHALLHTRWTALRHITLCPQRIGDITAAALVVTTLERGNY